MKNACRMGVVVLFMSLGTSGILFAQSDLGRISGFIKDPSGATIANAKVTVQNKSGVERQTATNESGYYVITNVPPDRMKSIADGRAMAWRTRSELGSLLGEQSVAICAIRHAGIAAELKRMRVAADAGAAATTSATREGAECSRFPEAR